MREFNHPKIDHTFMVRDITFNDILNGETWFIEIDGVKLCREDCDWMVMMSNHSGGQTRTLSDLSLPILQHILKQTNKDG